MSKSTTSHGIQSMNYHVSSVVDGSPISVRQWLPPPEVQTKAVVQLTHGISEHSGRDDRFARYLTENPHGRECLPGVMSRQTAALCQMTAAR
jgi:hypothetical protein